MTSDAVEALEPNNRRPRGAARRVARSVHEGFWALLILTVLEYAYARFLEGRSVRRARSAGLMVLAVTKAFLVGWFFMHLKFEGRWIYMMLVPVCLLAVVVVLGLTPDIALHRRASRIARRRRPLIVARLPPSAPTSDRPNARERLRIARESRSSRDHPGLRRPGGGAGPRAAREPRRAGQDLATWGTTSARSGSSSGRAGRDQADLGGRRLGRGVHLHPMPDVLPEDLGVMKGLQGPLSHAGVRLVSLSVDPDYDTPAVLARYAEGLGADPARWWFLTGKPDEVVDLILNRFHLPVAKDEGVDRRPEARAEAVRHSPRLVLVDRGEQGRRLLRLGRSRGRRPAGHEARRKASWARSSRR